MDKDRKKRLREGVLKAYSAAAQKPKSEHPFPVGRKFAISLGYPPNLLATLPICCVKSFAGVSNVSLFSEIGKGDTVLDVGCGSGLDSLAASERVGPNGKVIGLDFSFAMLERASLAIKEGSIKNVVLCHAEAENMPIKDESIDVALINGIFNLNPMRDEIFSELSRVVKKGGLAYAAELILIEPLPPDIIENETEWFK